MTAADAVGLVAVTAVVVVLVIVAVVFAIGIAGGDAMSPLDSAIPWFIQLRLLNIFLVLCGEQDSKAD